MSFKNKIHFMKIDNNERKSCDVFKEKEIYTTHTQTVLFG